MKQSLKRGRSWKMWAGFGTRRFIPVPFSTDFRILKRINKSIPMNTINKPPGICTLDYLFQTYGEDALEACQIRTDLTEEDPILVPTVRERLSVEEWLALPQEFRLFVLAAFYHHL
ncbi:hypothetical protein [Telluribacter humicola]|uniref:hypothetical protein n=1 Tax=Telluribacter humicola TaxID=1720261 RepID=UPI001A95F557|nr:hypothetical protein [Telluribacter humicola]